MNSLEDKESMLWDCIKFKKMKQKEDNDKEDKEELLVIDAKKFTYKCYLKYLRSKGTILRTDLNQSSLGEKPSWFDDDLFKHASSVYERHFMGINFAHLSGLLLLVRVDSVYRTLNATGESDSVSKLFKRYYHTVKHVKTWYEGDIFDEQGDAHKSFLIVRGMHNKVSQKFNSKVPREPIDTELFQPTGVHLSKFDIMLTQFAFVGFIVCKSKSMGLLDDFSPKDLKSLLHFWRVIGHYLGTSDEYNLCSYKLKDIVGLCETIIDVEYKKSIVKNPLSSANGLMSLNIIRAVKFIPMLTIYGMLRYLYELLDLDVRELESKRDWYSHLSYTLIHLVMTKLLAYRPFRSFNNGLTRLSVHLVGRVESWFAKSLENQYSKFESRNIRVKSLSCPVGGYEAY